MSTRRFTFALLAVIFLACLVAAVYLGESTAALCFGLAFGYCLGPTFRAPACRWEPAPASEFARRADEFLRQLESYRVDRRVPGRQVDGAVVMRDPVTSKAYDPMTGAEIEPPLVDPVVEYWHAHYLGEACTLCGNSGFIDTRGVTTYAGVPVGRVNYCICPNGQAWRENGAKLPD